MYACLSIQCMYGQLSFLPASRVTAWQLEAAVLLPGGGATKPIPREPNTA